MKISVGDMVTLKPMKVTDVINSTVVCEICELKGIYFDKNMIASVEPRPFKVGDMVLIEVNGLKYRIECIVGHSAAISYMGILQHRTFLLETLSLAD